MNVSDVLSIFPRRSFLPAGQRRKAGVDGPLPIGHGATNSQPRTVAEMLRLLDVRPGHAVLDVGAGSGWTTAMLAGLTGPTGSVVAVEVVPDLVEFARANLAGFDLPWAEVRQAEPHVLGWPAGAPYDRILVSAEARELPGSLVEQLADDGVMVIPVRGTMLRVRQPRAEVTRHGSYRFVPLV